MSVHNDILPDKYAAPPTASVRWFGLSRSELMTLLYILSVGNALLPLIAGGIANDGIIYAVLNTFEVSAIVWGALALGIVYSLRSEGGVRPLDKVVAGVTVAGCLMPLGLATWGFVTLVALYGILSSRRDAHDWQHRAGWIFLAITVPMFWSKRLFNLFAEVFLSIDAAFVSLITHTERVSNLVAIPGGQGYLQIAAQCSSLANVSLAVLCWVLFTQAAGMRWRLANLAWCSFACLAVIAINVSRISLIGFYPHLYELIHGPIGSTVASWVTVFVVLAVCYYGVGRGRLNAF